MRQCLEKFHTIFKVIFTRFLRNFTKFLKDFQEIFKRILWILGKNFTQFLRKFYTLYICDFHIYSWSITQKFMLFCFVFSHSVQEQIGNRWFRVLTRSYLFSLLNIYLWSCYSTLCSFLYIILHNFTCTSFFYIILRKM